MNQSNASMTVIGAGSYGTALAITLARNGHQVVLWGHDPKHIATLEHDRCNVAFLPDVPFPDTLRLESDLATALAASRNILVVVPSHVFGEVLRNIKPLMRPDARLVWATKGLEAETGRLLQDVAREALGGFYSTGGYFRPDVRQRAGCGHADGDFSGLDGRRLC
ncbi:2-dehydropantoate 2-reductase N-terminal domain-containing protein [Citrobacter freundii]|nr:2-dehydropantoate 2-reductase N-terminal domain-containing protein [Citrobacter freundii]